MTEPNKETEQYTLFINDGFVWDLLGHVFPEYLQGKPGDVKKPVETKWLIRGHSPVSIPEGNLHQGEFFQTCHFSERAKEDGNPIYEIIEIEWGRCLTVEVCEHWQRWNDCYGKTGAAAQ